MHPDHQPPERRELATRVTQELTALKPFVFPAPPKRDPKKSIFAESSRNDSVKANADKLSEALHQMYSYPCQDCAETTPYHYCDACKAEYEKREKEKRERHRARQRKSYRQRKDRERRYGTPQTCVVCSKPLDKRTDAKCCGAACRQKLFRQRKAGMPDKPPSKQQMARRQNQERKANIKAKWKKVYYLPRGSKVVVNGAGSKKYPRGTKLEVSGWWGWKVYLKAEGEQWGQDFNSHDIDAYDIVPENEISKGNQAA